MSAVAAEPRVGEVQEERSGSERRCLARGISVSRQHLIRFVVSPGGAVVPDIEERLPGRGLWVTADRTALDTAVRRKLFAKAARQPVRVPEDLLRQVELLLVRRCRDLVGLACRAGQAVFGYQKVREQLVAGLKGMLLEAIDGASGDCRKLRALAPEMPVLRVLTAAEIGAAVGRDHIVHGVIRSGRLAELLSRDADRLSGLRPVVPAPSDAR
jgi:predicted RNA-binding protein YlxR (DUF448 family)